MHCVVTAGPTFEPLDEVRRLTNFSTGKLGTRLAEFLVEAGHRVTLLYGHYATHPESKKTQRTIRFDTTADLRAKLAGLASEQIGAVYHAAAVSDFGFGKIWERSATGELREARAGKISTRAGTLLAELIPTEKIIGGLRGVFPDACLVGWKYEVDGDRDSVMARAMDQIRGNKTDACVANGKAYGFGFGLITSEKPPAHFSDTRELFAALEKLATMKRS